MSIKTLFAFLAGAVGFLLAAAAVWFYLAVRVAKEGGSSPPLVADRVGAILFACAFGAALASAGVTYVSIRQQAKRPLNAFLPLFLMYVLPFFGTFAILFAAHSQLHSMQFSDDGEPQSPWGYLVICGLPVVVGNFAGAKIVAWFGEPAHEPEAEST